jgi:transcription initiation factor TFIID TATA-box-binding protein
METVNIVATGQLNIDELDLKELSQDLDDEVFRLKPGRLDVRLDDESPLVMIYRSGIYTIPGASSSTELSRIRERFIEHLRKISDGYISEDSFAVKYRVFMTDLDMTINLERLTIQLGLENVEYEPEQFPGVIYRVDEPAGVVLIFSSGKILFTGFKSESEAENICKELKATCDLIA